jgi:hypothetical protein
MAFYKGRAKQLRDEAFLDMGRGLWAFLQRIVRRTLTAISQYWQLLDQ